MDVGAVSGVIHIPIKRHPNAGKWITDTEGRKLIVQHDRGKRFAYRVHSPDVDIDNGRGFTLYENKRFHALDEYYLLY